MKPNGKNRERKILDTISRIAAIADMIPGVIVIHELPEMPEMILRYMSKSGIELLGVSWSEIDGMSSAEYHKRFFNQVYRDESIPKILRMLENNSDEEVTHFQQVRTSKVEEWDWYMSKIKILARDDERKPLMTITTALKIDPQHSFTLKASRLIEENTFLRNHFHEFSTLTKRELEVLKLVASGKSTAEVAELIHISIATAETHRKNIKQKLNASNTYDLSLYARAFDLI